MSTNEEDITVPKFLKVPHPTGGVLTFDHEELKSHKMGYSALLRGIIDKIYEAGHMKYESINDFFSIFVRSSDNYTWCLSVSADYEIATAFGRTYINIYRNEKEEASFADESLSSERYKVAIELYGSTKYSISRFDQLKTDINERLYSRANIPKGGNWDKLYVSHFAGRKESYYRICEYVDEIESLCDSLRSTPLASHLTPLIPSMPYFKSRINNRDHFDNWGPNFIISDEAAYMPKPEESSDYQREDETIDQ